MEVDELASQRTQVCCAELTKLRDSDSHSRPRSWARPQLSARLTQTRKMIVFAFP